MDSSPSKRLGTIGAVLLIFIALIFDLFSLIPLAGDILGPVFWIGVTIFLWTKGFGWFNFRRAIPTVLSLIGEMIPVVQELPTMLAGAIVLIILLKIEERTGISAKGIATGKVNQRDARQALNNGGFRRPRPTEPQLESTRNRNNLPLVTDGVRAPSAAPQNPEAAL